MIIYIDVLLTVNFITDYFLLLLTAKLNKVKYKNSRLIFGALIGSVFSLYIFYENSNIFLNASVRFLGSALMIIVGIGFNSIKSYFRNILMLFGVSFLYCGGMFAVWLMFRINTIIINNSVVYLDISPLSLIGFSILFYFLILFFKSTLKKNALRAERAEVTLYFCGRKEKFKGIFDTGNSVKDLMSNSEVIFIAEKLGEKFINGKPKDFQNMYRILPCGTVTGSKLLEGVRIDKANIQTNNSEITLTKPILVFCDLNIDSEFSLLLNPEILEYAEEKSYAVKNRK